MPSRPLQPCKQPGCAELVAKGYCAAHQRADNRRYYERRRADPLLRLRDAFYKTAAWLALRAWRLSIEPLCRMCKELGLVTAATCVDHIEPIAQAWDRRLDPDNTQSLCDSCHARKSAIEGSRW